MYQLGQLPTAALKAAAAMPFELPERRGVTATPQRESISPMLIVGAIVVAALLLLRGR